MLSTQNLNLATNWKFKPRFIGPLKVTKRIGTQAYQLKLPVALSKVSNIVHILLLRKYTVGGDEIGTVQPIELDRETKWEVVAILEHRFNCRLKKMAIFGIIQRLQSQ